MRLFGRGRGKDDSEPPARTRPHSHLALAPEDREDAARCEPPGDLQAFAAARGLTFGGSVFTSALVGMMPNWDRYVFNSSRGVLAGGRYGVVEHELMEIAADPNDDTGSGVSGMGGSFWSVRRGIAPGTARRLIPGAIEMGWADARNEPFGAYAFWTPSTTVAVNVPEAACVPRLSVWPSDRQGGIGTTKLDPYGVPGFTLVTDVDEPTRAAIFGGPAGALLLAVDAPFVRLRMHHGQLALTRNGFVMDDATLDALIASTVGIADAIAAAVGHRGPPARFEDPLPAPVPDTSRLAGIDNWDATFAAASKKFDLVQEDGCALHAAFPHLPVPGRARGVFRGRLPGVGVPGRLSFHDPGGPRAGRMRGAALFPAPPGAEPTPPGGVPHPATDMVYGVADGVAACWNRITEAGTIGLTPTSEKAVATLREVGLMA